MYLSRLEMVGFKSFAQKTDLSFNDGVTAIVGPNGCGKTNIVDAIRWVLGEQKTSMLRADSMEQVIFNGSKTRKPLGMSEVSLTIENNKRILPTEYSQVVITRRLFRSGESQYLLNKTQCRLRDIIDLFMDTGMGSNAYSVIELKMIETILSDKADERRHLFEEAAGVTKYKVRRREAQRKLEYAQRDISRVQDIVREVQKTVNSLARQAEKARLHQEISTKLKNMDALLFSIEYAEEYLKLKQLEAQVSEIRSKRETADKVLADSELLVVSHEEKSQDSEIELRNAAAAESEIKDALAQLVQQKSIIEERIASAKRNVERLERENTESISQRSMTDGEMRDVHLRIESMQQELNSSTREFDAHQKVSGEAQNAVMQARDAVQIHREGVSASRQACSDANSRVERLRHESASIERRINENHSQMDGLSQRVAEINAQIQSEQQYLPDLESALAKAEDDLHQAENRQRELRSEQEELQTEANELRSAFAHTTASLDFLIGLVDNAESSKFLLTTDEWKPVGEKLTLAEVLNTSDEYRVAVEAALGEAARYFVVASKTEAHQAIGALSHNSAGKATFLCRDTIPSLGQPESLGAIDGLVGWASELITCDDVLKGAVRGILAGTVVVRDIDSAWTVINNSTALAAVTLSGEIAYKAGALRGGASSKTEGVRVGRKERVAQLSDEKLQLEDRLTAVDLRLLDVKSELMGIDIRALGETVRRATVARNDRQQRIAAYTGRTEDVASQLGVVQTETTQFSAEQEALDQAIVKALEEYTTATASLGILEEKSDGFVSQLAQAEVIAEGALKTLRDFELFVVRLQGELQNLQADAGRLTSKAEDIVQRNEQRMSEHQSLDLDLKNLEEELVQVGQLASESEVNLASAKSKRELCEHNVAADAQAFHTATEEVRKNRKLSDNVVSELHSVELRFSEVRLRIESMVQRATDELGIEINEDFTVPDTDFDVSALRVEIQESRRRLTMMGNVNFLALEEHERESERYNFLATQLADLVESEKTLTTTIAEINQTAREKFTTTFNSIRENFISLFKVLFSEDDEADMQMIETADNDPLECSIDIMAKPRGKRPHSIEMLSGGEKTLTAIALLFAIYMVKPSPFCILDEVDAPLDDANIDRYLKIIKKFSDQTQFLMITHNKRTMEAADTLYGVTMEEPAVSKVVSVQLGSDNPTKAA